MDFYSPAEDSFLLEEIVVKYLSKLDKKTKLKLTALDLGTGSGIQSRNLIKLGIKKENITAIDINPHALKEAKKLKVKTIKSNLFENVKNKYDLILFNPPYLPEDQYDKEKDTTGGKKGDETIVRFIKSLKPHLNKNGVCFLLTSSLTPNSWKKTLKKQNIKLKKVAEKNIFMEKLYVWKIEN